jgi:hypothetical protein
LSPAPLRSRLGTLFVAAAALFAAQRWTEIHNAMFFSYQDHRPTEKTEPALRDVYDFPRSALGSTATCTYGDVFPWFVNPGGADLTGTHPDRNPSTGSIAGPFRGVTGLEFTGSFDGKATGTPSDYVWEVVFFHEQRCYSGGIEFGFRRDAVGAAFQAYWSINSNCGLDDGHSTSICRAARGTGARVQESTGAVNLPYSAGVKRYRMSASKGKFLIEILEPRPWSVWVNPNAAAAWFRSPADPHATFPIDKLPADSGYVTVGVQRSATNTVKPDRQNPPAVRVRSVRIAYN